MLVIAFFAVAGLMLAVGPAVEQVREPVESNDAVQDQGWDDIPGDIQTSVLDYAPRIFMIGMIGWAVVWYLRKEQFQGGI